MFYAECIGVYMTYLCMKFHLHNSSGLLLNGFIPIGREHLHIAAMFLFHLKCSTEVEYF
jgi:hypothetical protein